jgi:type I restriction enzyme S subunit
MGPVRAARVPGAGKNKKAEVSPPVVPVQVPAVGAGLTPEGDRLLENFAVLAEAPGGVKRVRELILDLAVTGRLVSHGQGAAVVESAEGRAATDFYEPGFDVPSHWRWLALGSACRFIDYRGRTPTKTSQGVRLLTAKNVRAGYVREEPVEYIAERDYAGWMTRGIPEHGDVLFTTEAPLGNVAQLLVRERVALAQRIITLHPMSGLDSAYVKTALMTPLIQSSIVKRATGTTAQGIKASRLKLIPIPLPPLAEQTRIVAKVDQLMALCDDMEARQAKQRDRAARMSRAALVELAAAEGPEELAACWQRVADDFGAIIEAQGSVSLLRETILELGVRGTLERQSAADQPAEALLQHIVAERERIKPGSSSEPVRLYAESAATHTLPPSWRWGSLEMVTHPVRVVRYGMLMPGPDQPTGPLYVKVRNMKNGVIDVASLPRTTPEIYGKYAGAALGKGDLLMSIRGSYGGVALVPDEIEGANITQDSARIAPLPWIDRVFLMYVLRAPLCQDYFAAVAKGAAVQGLNISDIRRTPIPLPPLAEQRRIVAKVDRLLSLCTTLEAALRHAEDKARRAADALVAELLA